MKILVADDQYEWREPLSEICRKAGHDVVAVSDGEDVLKMTETTLRSFHAVLLDYKMPTTGLEAGKHIKKHSPDTLYMMLTAHSDTFTVEKAVEATKEGFFDYIDKNGDFKVAVARFLQHAEERSKINSQKQKQKSKDYTLDDIIGNCQQMHEMRELIKKVAPTDTTVLILGGSGTGKELVAGALHTMSRRRERGYIRINCAAIPEQLLESELFGHEKGAFTSALKQKPGRVEEADGGTIFLDEIGDMIRPLQAKLLRFLEDGTFTRVGGTQELKVNVRLLAATNRDIVKAIEEGHFREDLYHRLNVVQVRMPPLRERGDDIPLLANHFLKLFGPTMNKNVKNIAHTTCQILATHHWPGNVRELRNVIERALILETTNAILPSSLPDFNIAAQPTKTITSGMPLKSATDFDEQALRELCQQIEKTNGNKIKNDARVLMKHQTPAMSKAVLAVFYFHYKTKRNGLERFNELFGYKGNKRPTVEIRHDLARFSRDADLVAVFAPSSGNEYRAGDLKIYGKLLHDQGVVLASLITAI